jgi:hypothetical protein
MTLPDNSFLPAVVVPPHMKQGDTFRYAFRVRDRNLDGTPGDPVDLTGVTVRSQMRATPQDAVAVIDFDAAVAVDQVASKGVVLLEGIPADTELVDVPEGSLTKEYYWDVQLTYPDGRVQTYIDSTIIVHADVTR